MTVMKKEEEIITDNKMIGGVHNFVWYVSEVVCLGKTTQSEMFPRVGYSELV